MYKIVIMGTRTRKRSRKEVKLMTIPGRISPKALAIKDETTPEQPPARRRRQILDDETLDRFEHETPEQKSAWVKDFIDRLAGVVRNIGGKS